MKVTDKVTQNRGLILRNKSAIKPRKKEFAGQVYGANVKHKQRIKFNFISHKEENNKIKYADPSYFTLEGKLKLRKNNYGKYL